MQNDVGPGSVVVGSPVLRSFAPEGSESPADVGERRSGEDSN